MKIAVAVEDNRGLQALMSQHFGRCPYYILVDVVNAEIGEVRAIENPFYGSHGGPGEVPAFIKKLGAQVIIAGGMGPKAIGFFEQYGIQVVTGVSGAVQRVIELYLNGEIEGASPCMDHESDHDMNEIPQDAASQLRDEIRTLRKQLDLATERVKGLEEQKNQKL
jgi:predicted Fe-Mo cluster-binding NifX family protein